MEQEQADETRLDLPLEYCRYQDESCEFAESCLSCSFPVCICDESGGRQCLLKRQRAKEMVRLLTVEGKETKALAEMFGVSQRTVQGALKVTFGDWPRGAMK